MHGGAGVRFAVHETAILRTVRDALMAIAAQNFAMKHKEHPGHLETIPHQPPDAVAL